MATFHLTIIDSNLEPIPDESGIIWARYSQFPTEGSVPTDWGTSGTTDSSGKFSFNSEESSEGFVTLKLQSGDVGISSGPGQALLHNSNTLVVYETRISFIGEIGTTNLSVGGLAPVIVATADSLSEVGFGSLSFQGYQVLVILIEAITPDRRIMMVRRSNKTSVDSNTRRVSPLITQGGRKVKLTKGE